MSDKSEDDPVNPPVWRTPCSCSLTAHEACLLDWVADLESPKNKNKQSGPIQCPQCKSEIRISRPKNRIVEGYRAIDRSLGKFVLPGLGLSLIGTTWAGLWFHGFQSVYLVFGHDDANRIFRYAAAQRREFLWMYSLIPVNLILARTDYADFALPGSSLILLSTQITDKFEVDYTMWPPLPSTVFACLPALRSLYNWCYHVAFCDLNKKWLAEVQPTHAQQRPVGQIQVEDEEQNEEAQEGNMVLEIEINDHGVAIEDMGEDGPVENGNGGDPQGQQENPHVQRILRQEFLDTGNIGTTILGALVFPAVAAGAGRLLSYVLPTTWLTYRNYTNGRPGLLSTKWGRSVVGGCLFVVFKDALLVYCRWKLAQGHRQRRIMNFDKKTKNYSV
jgi:hypothetical protein